MKTNFEVLGTVDLNTKLKNLTEENLSGSLKLNFKYGNMLN
jgi:hypothetical protein